MAGRITAIITTTIIIRPLRPVRHRMVFMAVMRPGTGRTPSARRRMAGFTGLARLAGIFMAGITAVAHAAESFKHPGGRTFAPVFSARTERRHEKWVFVFWIFSTTTN